MVLPNGISPEFAQRATALAAMPEDEFEGLVNDTHAALDVVVTPGAPALRPNRIHRRTVTTKGAPGHVRKGKRNPASGHVRIVIRNIDEIRPSPENDTLYRPIDPNDPEIVALAKSIKEHGIREAIVITEDGFILSGHRRYAAAKLAGLTEIPVRIQKGVSRAKDRHQFVVLLREHNRQRDKSNDEKLREELLAVNPNEAYYSLISHREKRSAINCPEIELGERKRRSAISDVKSDMLAAMVREVQGLKDYWPITLRALHYNMLNAPPLRNTDKGTRYVNDKNSYKDLSDLCTRARFEGLIPWAAISDETRPVDTWQVHADPRAFIRDELSNFGKGYYRDLMRSQPNHIELIVEKNTVAGYLRSIASHFCLPMISGRGFCSVEPRRSLVQRYRKSGKECLVIVCVSDFDPSGLVIAESFARSLRDDFGVETVKAVKAALSYEQVQSLGLKKAWDRKVSPKAKTKDPNYGPFVAKYGRDVYELEAVRPDVLQQIVRETLDGVIDVDAFNAELDSEKEDAAWLEQLRIRVHHALQSELPDMSGRDGSEGGD